MNTDNQLKIVTNKWFVVLLITVALGCVFFFYEAISVKNILEIEFSGNLGVFKNNIAGNLEKIRTNTYYDFVFILGYTLLFYFTYRVFQSSMRIPVSKLWVLLCMIPGILDIIENILLLNLINHAGSNGLFNVFWLVVRAKWTLVIPFVMINLTILIYYLLRFINSFFS